MEKGITIFFISISIFISVILPIIAAVYLNRKFKALFKAVFTGALIFIVFQPLTRIQILRYLQTTNWFSYNVVVNPWIISLAAGVSAGVFENIGRLIGFKFLLKNKLEWKNGIAYGIGHGGIEAIIFAGVPFVNLVIGYIKNEVSNLGSPALYLVGGIERLSAMTFHIAASLMVLYAVRNKKYIYLLYAILIHSVMDSSIGFIKNVVIIEVFVAAVALGSIIFIIYKIKATSNEYIKGDIK